MSYHDLILASERDNYEGSDNYEESDNYEKRDNPDSSQYELFCKILEDNKYSNDILFMILIVLGIGEIQSHRCCQKIIDMVDLSINQVKLCVLLDLECMPEIYAKTGITVTNKKSGCDHIVKEFYDNWAKFDADEYYLGRINSWLESVA